MKRFIYLLSTLFLSASASAQHSFLLKVSGEVASPTQISLQDLAALPHTTAVLNDKDGKPHSYRGVPITSILNKAGATTGKELKGENMAKYVVARCADGYQVLFSLAELDSSFTDRVVIIADTVEGKPLPESRGPLRVVVPGEKKPARSCYQLVELAVGYSKQ